METYEPLINLTRREPASELTATNLPWKEPASELVVWQYRDLHGWNHHRADVCRALERKYSLYRKCGGAAFACVTTPDGSLTYVDFLEALQEQGADRRDVRRWFSKEDEESSETLREKAQKRFEWRSTHGEWQEFALDVNARIAAAYRRYLETKITLAVSLATTDGDLDINFYDMTVRWDKVYREGYSYSNELRMFNADISMGLSNVGGNREKNSGLWSPTYHGVVALSSPGGGSEAGTPRARGDSSKKGVGSGKKSLGYDSFPEKLASGAARECGRFALEWVLQLEKARAQREKERFKIQSKLNIGRF